MINTSKAGTETRNKPDLPSGEMPLSENKRKVLEKLLRGDGVRSQRQPAITRRPPNEPVPLSFPQLQVWLHTQMATESPFYNEIGRAHV